jgi:hypothetical protein
MNRIYPVGQLLAGGIGLGGCGPVEQASNLPGRASKVLARDPREQHALQSSAANTASAL